MKYISILLSFFALLALPVSFVRAVENADTDGDGLFDGQETQLYHSDPKNHDTDGDGFGDGEEVHNGYSPLVSEKKKLAKLDTDKDGLNDAVEIALTTDLTKSDTDNDGYADGTEVFQGYNPLSGDRDRAVKRVAKVDLTTQQLRYYLNDVEVGSMPISSGVLATPTPTGEFAIMRKLPVHRYVGPGYDLPNTKWNLEFKRSFYLHGAYWHNQFGIRPMSHGCVNIATKNAEKLYAFLDVGDMVSIAGKAPRRVAQIK